MRVILPAATAVVLALAVGSASAQVAEQKGMTLAAARQVVAAAAAEAARDHAGGAVAVVDAGGRALRGISPHCGAQRLASPAETGQESGSFATVPSADLGGCSDPFVRGMAHLPAGPAAFAGQANPRRFRVRAAHR